MEGKEMQVDREMLMDTPVNLPQTNLYKLPKFYVRECYDQYYNDAFRLLQVLDFDSISITGNKGKK